LRHKSKIIRNCISGGEPFTHPHIEKILDLPNIFPDCGFAIVTNGTLKKHLDSKLIENKWCILISLHGMEKAHNTYTNSCSFKTVVDRITKLASKGYVNIYTVINNYLQPEDIKWLLKFRDDAGVSNIRFLKPRPFGRYVTFKNETASSFIEEINDDRVRKMSTASNIPFIDVNGELRQSN
jgi:MoaA/NifB/PqqE/SkfB family radical SAM enzyme